jgi:superfamily II DNA or RNA helicase
MLGKSFTRHIRREGKRLYTDGDVTLVDATERRIAATVRDEDADEVVIELGENSVRAECDCRFWHHGTPCHHMWGAILAADAELARRTAEARALRKPAGVQKAAPGVSSPETEGSVQPWRALLAPGGTDVAGVRRVPGEFVPSYELHVVSNAVWIKSYKRRVLKSGELGQPTRIGMDTVRNPGLAAGDRSILNLVLGAMLQTEFLRRGYVYNLQDQGFDNFRPDTATLSRVLPELAASGRCALILNGDVLFEALRPGGKAHVAWTPGSQGAGGLTYEARLQVMDREIVLTDVPVFLSTDPIMFVHDGLLHSLTGVGYDWVVSMRRRKGKVRIPKTEMRDLVRTVLGGSLGAAVEIPEAHMPAVRQTSGIVPCLELIMDRVGVGTRVWFDYGGFEVSHDDPRAQVLDIESWTRFERDFNREKELAAAVADLDFGRTGGTASEQTDVWDRLDGLAKRGWVLRGSDKRRIHVGNVGAIRVSSGVDWFDLEGVVDFGGVVVPLPVAVRAHLKGESLVDLGNGETGLLPREWLGRHAQMLALGEKVRGREESLHFHCAHARLLDELLEQCPQQPLDFLELRRRLKSFEGVATIEPPSAFTGTLRPYQHEALGWFDFLASFGFGGILADDMGLGKTVQVLAWLALLRQRETRGPSLVVGPTSLLFNWREEAVRFAPELRVLTYAGPDRADLHALFRDHDLVLTTYGLLRRDADILRRTEWACVILDESQAIKNPDTQTAKAARLLPAAHRLCLTGTPLENRLSELWSQMHFLNPGLLGSRQGFESRFVKPVEQGDAEARELLQGCLKPFLLRRTKGAVARDLPEKQESVVRCEMTPAQAKVYERLHAHYRSEILAAVERQGLERSQIKVLEGLLRLRQAACHPALVGHEGAGSGKLDELGSRIAEVVAEGHKALVFSQFTRFLSHVREKLRELGVAHEYLDGRTPVATREKRVASFQDPDGPPVFCISLKAGGVGLNLTAADYVFILDPWWNPAVEAQAVNRAHRIGQDRTVFAYRLIAQDTIDEKVLALQERKKDIADALLEGAASSVGALTLEDLERLLE